MQSGCQLAPKKIPSKPGVFLLFTASAYFTDFIGFRLDNGFLTTFGRLLYSSTKHIIDGQRNISCELFNNAQQQLTPGWRHVATAPGVMW